MALVENVWALFSEAAGIVASFDIFNPLTVFKVDSPEFKDYGEEEVEKILTHVYLKVKEHPRNTWTSDKTSSTTHILTMKEMLPKDVKDGSGTQTPIDLGVHQHCSRMLHL